MDGIKSKSPHHPSSTAHRSLQKSTTLNRKFVKKPSSTRVIKSSERAALAAERRAQLAAELNRKHLLAIQQKTSAPVKKSPAPAEKPTAHPIQASANARRTAPPPPRQLTARQLKEQAVRRALDSVQHLSPKQATIVEEQMAEIIGPKKHFWRRKKFVLTLAISVVSVAFLGFLVYRNLPDIISQVTARSSGIEASTPAYMPKGYYRESISSEKSGKITLTYVNSDSEQGSFTITQEKSSWNTAALLTNFVKPTWDNNYSTTREGGLTIYISGSNAAWVNGGIFYLIEASNNNLTMSDLHDIAISI